MEPRRITVHHQGRVRTGKPVLYWLQHTQRIDQNYALNEAIRLANEHNTTLRVIFCLLPGYPEANARHYHFMLEGIRELFERLDEMGAEVVLKEGSFADKVIPELENGALLVMDCGYTRFLRRARHEITEAARRLDIGVREVESDVVVPVHAVSEKLEYGARTIRPKLQRLKPAFMKLEESPALQNRSKKTGGNSKNVFPEPSELIERLNIDRRVGRTAYFAGGEKAALARFNHFLTERLPLYHRSNDPGLAAASKLSPYLHFGQISPVRMLHRLTEKRMESPALIPAIDAYEEQLLVRRELSFNFVSYEPGYDSFQSMTYPWAYKTMDQHRGDWREYLYKLEDYEALATHDPYFNAAMREMVVTGYMHNYMRMYWGKKIIEWSRDYEEAYNTTVYLNNKYFLDGRDPNSYTGVAWCYGRHDRAWGERPVFGKLRYMNAAGLRRKFAIEDYVRYCEGL